MAVLIAASIVEYSLGTLSMAVVFVGIACGAFACARQAQLARPLLSILAFRLSAQCAMTFGTGSVLLATLLHDTPACTSSTIRSSAWRAPLVPLLRGVLPPRLLRRIFGVVPPRAPPFLRLLAAVLSHEWLGWVPSLGLPSARPVALASSSSVAPPLGPPSAWRAAQPAPPSASVPPNPAHPADTLAAGVCSARHHLLPPLATHARRQPRHRRRRRRGRLARRARARRRVHVRLLRQRPRRPRVHLPLQGAAHTPCSLRSARTSRRCLPP